MIFKRRETLLTPCIRFDLKTIEYNVLNQLQCAHVPIHTITYVCMIVSPYTLQGRSLRTTLPQVQDQYIPHWEYLETFKELNAEFKLKQKMAYDQRH